MCSSCNECRYHLKEPEPERGTLNAEPESSKFRVPRSRSSSLRNRATAVDNDDLSSDVVRGVGREKHDDALELARITDARNRARRLDAGLRQRDGGIRQPGM